jgi:thiosulfate/3-mercaptopyruvate sulfurtransferase
MKTYEAIISQTDCADLHRSKTPPVVVDWRFDLSDPTRGRRDYETGHIPGAFYIHLDEDLCRAKTGLNGRHPLPERQYLVNWPVEFGVDMATQIVAYDDSDGMYAARLWWMTKWVGYRTYAVLDGGLAEWKALGGALTDENHPRPAPGKISLGGPLVTSTAYEEVSRAADDGSRIIVDARAPEHYHGEVEPIDPIGGHIPGAVNRFFEDNRRSDGLLKSSSALRDEFTRILGDQDPANVITQCCSGVTACHNVLAMTVAGMERATLYPGSWSEWCARATPDQIAKG